MRLINADELIEHVWLDRLDSRERIAEMVYSAPTIAEFDGEINRVVVRGVEYYKWPPVNNSEINKLKSEIDDLKSSNDFLRRGVGRLEGTIKALEVVLRAYGILGKGVDDD